MVYILFYKTCNYKTFHGAEINKQTFVVDTQKTSSMAHPLSELEQWLKDNNINKKQ